MKQLVSTIRDELKNQSALLAKPFGLELLSKTETEAYLNEFGIAFHPAREITLPRTRYLAEGVEGLFDQAEVTTAHARVWQYERADQKAVLLRCGALQIENQVLNTDFGTTAVFKDLLRLKKREPYEVGTLIAPWSHYWGRYYDYLLFVAAKLCRIKDALPASVFRESFVSYPLLDTAFERELLTLIGFKRGQVIDSRTTEVSFERCVLGNTDSWFYPNVADVLALKKHIGARMPTRTDLPRRIYVSRAGRRRILNEEDVITLLERYGFTVVEDIPRTLSEQYAIYHNASFIIGPHGASFANVLWCQPGAHLFELFAPNYVPEYFRYLAHVVGVDYSAYCHGPIKNNHHSNVDSDIYVSTDQLERYLNVLFEDDVSARR